MKGLDLKIVIGIEDCSKRFGTSTRIRLTFTTSNVELGLKFSSGGKEEFLNLMSKMLQKKSWESIDNNQHIRLSKGLSIATPALPPQFSVSNAGVGGLIRRQEKNIETLDSVAKSALSDLNNLMQQVILFVDRRIHLFLYQSFLTIRLKKS